MWACLSYQLFLNQILKNNTCKTAFQCITRGINSGLYGDMLGLHGDNHGNIWMLNGEYPEYIEQWYAVLQWLFVLVFFLIWNYVLAGIVQGTIVDAFSEIRSIQAARDADRAEFCLICSMSKYTVDNISGQGSFRQHVDGDHSPWSYLYFYAAIDELEDHQVMKGLEFHRTGQHSYVAEILHQQSATHVPIKTCWDLVKAPESMDSIGSKVDDLGAELAAMKDAFAALEGKLDAQAAATPGSPRGGRQI